MSWNEILNPPNNNSVNNESAVKYCKLKAGTNKLRVLDEEPYSRWSHWIPQANSGKGTSVDCIGKGCPVCAKIKEDKANGAKQKYSTKKAHAINVLNRETNEVEILDSGNKIFQGLAILLSQMGDLRGYDVNIVKSGSGTSTTYQVLPVYPPVPLTDAEKSMKLYDIKSIYKKLTPEQILGLMSGKSLAEVTKTEETEEATATNENDTALGVDFGEAIAD
jgi:hypothetical protein